MIPIPPAIHASGRFLERTERTAVLVALLLAIMIGTAGADETKPVARYAFDEGRGSVLHDSSGNGNRGTIHGAAWVTCGNGFALSFDGVDDYVDCGAGASLNLSDAVTVEAWVRPAAIPGAGEAGVLGKCYGSFFLTQYTDGNFWWYIGGGGSSVRAPVPPGRWHHVVGTFDGEISRLYIDGAGRGSKTFERRAIAEGGAFFMGTSSGDSHFTKGYFYKGLIAEVTVYDGVLSAEEIAGRYRTTRLTGEIAVHPYLYPTAETIVAGFDLRTLGELPDEATLRMELLPAGGSSPLAESGVSRLSTRHVLPNINVLIGTGGADQEPMLKEWKKRGKRWLVECPAIGFITKDPVTADGVQKYLVEHAGFSNPLIDGVIVDEFSGSENQAYAAWTEALERIRAHRRFADKLIYPYCAPMHGAKASSRFIRTVMDSQWRFAFERHLPEQRGEAACRGYLDAMLPGAIDQWQRAIPGSTRRMIVCMGTFSQPPESLDVNPAVDYKVYLDRQLNLLPNDRRCFGLYGVMTYLSTYTEPEIVRWMGRLFRHYCIEGHTEPYTADPLVLVHLENCDFELGFDGWQVDAAEPGGVDAPTRQGFSWLQGRYPMTGQGDTVLWMKRSARRPNLVRQKIRGLEPGRLYTLRICSGDYQDLSIRQELAISIRLDGAEVLPNRAKQDVFPSCYSHHHGPFDRDNPAWMNYHWIPFRAQNKEATLIISDWSEPKNPGGPAGQEIMLNFVQVQPFCDISFQD